MLVKLVIIGEYGYIPFSFAIMQLLNKSEIYINYRVSMSLDYSAS